MKLDRVKYFVETGYSIAPRMFKGIEATVELRNFDRFIGIGAEINGKRYAQEFDIEHLRATEITEFQLAGIFRAIVAARIMRDEEVDDDGARDLLFGQNG